MPLKSTRLAPGEDAESRPGRAAPCALVVEDHDAMRKLMASLLAAAGWEVVHQTSTVTQAIDLVRTRRPEYALIDLRLPDGTGEEVLRAVRDNPETRDATVVIMTADTDQDLQARLMAAGADAYVVKSEGLAAIRTTLINASHHP